MYYEVVKSSGHYYVRDRVTLECVSDRFDRLWAVTRCCRRWNQAEQESIDFLADYLG